MHQHLPLWAHLILLAGVLAFIGWVVIVTF
jgi:hypothetical protein